MVMVMEEGIGATSSNADGGRFLPVIVVDGGGTTFSLFSTVVEVVAAARRL